MNLRLDGRFQTVALFELPQEKLKQLFDNKCPYVGLTDDGIVEHNKDKKPIEVKPIKKITKGSKAKK